MKAKRILMVVVAMFTLNGFLSAGEKLDIKGSFSSELKDGVPEGWCPNKPGYWEDAAKMSLQQIPETGKTALQITSQTKALHLFSNKTFPIVAGDKCVVKAIIKGKGSVDLGLYYYPGGVFLNKKFQATEEWTENIAEIVIPKVSDYKPNPVIKEIRVVLGVSPGASIEFVDVSAEILKQDEREGVQAGNALTGAELVYSIYQLEQAPKMDGTWDDTVWKNVPAATGFRSISKGGLVSERQTSFKMGRYKDALYIAVECQEPQPGTIKADPNNYRDGWFKDDNLEFFFSRDRAPDACKQFVVNSRGASWCNLKDAAAAKSWQVAACVGTDKWSAEIKIPFSLLGIGGNISSDLFLFNLARAAYNNPEDEQLSSFAPVKIGFNDVMNFALLTFSNEASPNELAETQKNLSPLRSWLRDRIWKIAYVKEGFLVDRQVDDVIRDILGLKAQARAMLAGKNMNGASDLIKKYDLQIAESGAPRKRFDVNVQNREAKTKIFINGKELPPDPSGNYTVGVNEGLNVIAMAVTPDGKNPGLRLSIPGQPELENRWRVGTAANDSWLTAAFDDRSWKKAELDQDGYLSVPEGAVGNVCFRQIVLWGENHYSGLPCIQPKVREWGFSEKSVEPLFHALYSPPPLTYALEDYEFVLDVPKGFSLLKEKYADDAKGGKLNRRPKKITEEEVKHENQPYTRYRLAFESAFVQESNSKNANNNQVALIPLLLNEYKDPEKSCKFYFRRMASGNLTELEQTLPVRVLPPINGRMPKQVRIRQYQSVPHNLQGWHHDLRLGEALGGKLFPEHFEAHMQQSLNAGFNFWIINSRTGEYGKKVHDQVIERGGVVGLWYAFPAECYPLLLVRPDSALALAQLMRSVPEFRARYFNSTSDMATKNSGWVCRSYAVGQGAVRFKEAVKKDVGCLLSGSAELNIVGLPKASIYWTDWEHDIWNAQLGESLCFCDNCKTAFRKYAQLPESTDLSDDSIYKNYNGQWKSFREQQEGLFNGIVREVCNELGLKYMLYDHQENDGYWASHKGKIDFVDPGWPGDGMAVGNGIQGGVSSFPVPQQSLDERMAFYKKSMGVSEVSGQLFASYYPMNSKTPWKNWSQGSGSTKDGFLNAQGVKSQILRVVAAFHGGVDLDSSLERCAGQQYYIGEATRLIAEYEDLFYSGKREDSLAASEQLKYPNLLVLTKGEERLILLFNETDAPLTVQLNNKNLKPGQTSSVVGSPEKFSNPEKMTVTVDAGDVTAVHIK